VNAGGLKSIEQAMERPNSSESEAGVELAGLYALDRRDEVPRQSVQ